MSQKVEEHRLPIFSGITLCVSGIEDIEQCTAINRAVTQHSGKYVENIERPVRVTHLLCSGDDETERLRYARKFNERGEADINLVWEEWFWDSLNFGGRRVLFLDTGACVIVIRRFTGRFEESRYLVTRPRPERRQPSLHQSRTRAPEPPQEQSQVDVDAPEEEEIAIARRVPAATLRVWESLLAPRGYSKVGSELVKAGPTDPPNPTPVSSLPPSGARKDKGKGRALDPPAPESTHKGRSALATFRRSKSFAPCTTSAMEDPSTSTSRQSFRKTHSLFLPQLPSPAHPAPDQNHSKLQIFAGKHFRVRGEARSSSVRSAIENCGGTWVENEDEERVDFVIVRLVRYSPPSWLLGRCNILTRIVVAVSCMLMRQTLHSSRAIVLSAGLKAASHASGYAPWTSTPPSRHFHTRSISLA